MFNRPKKINRLYVYLINCLKGQVIEPLYDSLNILQNS